MTIQDFAEKVIRKLKYWHVLDALPDERYLKIMYWASMHKKLNLSNPTSFNEKIQWLKLHDRKPEYTQMVDKYEAKKYVADRIGKQYIIPTLGVWNHFDEIDFDSLPDQFVLKCTHDSGGLVICRDKNKLNLSEARRKIEKSLATNYYYNGREWPYKDVRPRIIAEEYMEDKESKELRDYKFFCFGGEVRCFKVDFDRFIEHHANYYDKDKNLLKFGEADYPPIYRREIEMPSNIDIMIDFAEQLSRNIPFLRADFYDVDGKTYFGELTFYPASGFGKFTSEEWDNVLGRWIRLPKTVCGGAKVYISKEIICVLRDLKRNASLTDYKFYCFNGEPHYLYISTGLENHETAKISFLNMNWEVAPFGRKDYEEFKRLPKKPNKFNEMIEISRILSKGIPFLRVDLYEVNNEIFFSELTFSPCSGMMPFSPENYDLILGGLLQLPQ